MPLMLDARRRAMLEAMRVPVWLPPPLAAAEGADRGRSAQSEADSRPARKAAPAAAPATPGPPARPALGAATPAPDVAAPATPSLTGAYALLPLQQPYGPGDAGAAPWLVVVECDHAQPEAFAGDAGRLLDAMLRALRLHGGSAAVHLARLVRTLPGMAGAAPAAISQADVPHAAGAAAADAAAALAHGIGQLRPAMVLALGRAPALLLLGGSEPLGRLRGRVHAAHGTRIVASHDPARLLRAPADKADAWADLCRAAEAAGLP